MSGIDIGRKVELWLCTELNEAMAARSDGLPPLTAFPAMGGGGDPTGEDSQDAAATPLGPYIGVRVTGSEERLGNALNTWAVEAEVIYIANQADVTSPVYARDARLIRDTLVAAAASCPGVYEPLALTVSGMEVSNGPSYGDSDEQTTGAALKVVLGVSD